MLLKQVSLPIFPSCALAYEFLVEMDSQWCFEHYLSHRSLTSADNVRAQLSRVMERNDLEMMSTPFEDPSYYTNIRRALTVGFFMQVAKKAQGAKHYVTSQRSTSSFSPSIYGTRNSS